MASSICLSEPARFAEQLALKPRRSKPDAVYRDARKNGPEARNRFPPIAPLCNSQGSTIASGGRFVNALCNKLGIKIPIILAPMGGAVGPELTAAVSNAGGLGLIPLWYLEPEVVRNSIRATRAITKQPFGVNLNLNWPQEDRLAICLDEGVKIISFFWGHSRALVERAHAAGATVLQTVSSAEEAKQAIDEGADIVVAQGWEAGGHVRGTVATLPLVPAVVDAVAPSPVVAAGGIADGRGLAAVMALGASAAWIGTRFLLSDECPIHPHYRERLIAAKETDTLYTSVYDVGWPDAPHRLLRNSTLTNWENAGSPPAGQSTGRGRGHRAISIGRRHRSLPNLHARS